MKPIIIIALILFLSISVSKSQSNENQQKMDNQSIEKNIFTEKVLDFVITNCDNREIELPNLYDSLTKIVPEDSVERLILVQLLKKRDFKIIHWSRGNHPMGPRFITIEMIKDSCECMVTKIYYSTIDENVYKVAERIKCKNVSR
jgi:hypothetical protein